MKVVNNFSKAADLDLFVTEVTEAKEWCQYPSWAVVKKVHQSIETPEALLKEGKIGAVGMQTYMKNKHDKRERHRIKWQFINGYLKPMLPNWIISFAKLLHKPWKKKEDCLCD